MAKVFGMHMIALHPGVKPEDFERFVTEKVYPAYAEDQGMQAYLLKGDRGDREGRYMMMFEFPSVEARNRLFPSPGEASEQARQMMAKYEKMTEEWGTLSTPLDILSTDYVTIGK